MKGLFMQQRRSYNAKNTTQSFGGTSRPGRRPQRAQKGNRGRGKQYIDPIKFVNRSVRDKAPAPAYEAKHTFFDFGLAAPLEDNLKRAGFTAPSAIQDQTIPFGLEGRDVIGLANTGTGKTAAFLLPVLQRLYRERTPQSVLIMAPTRELAQQIDEEFKKFSSGMKLYSAICVGGMNITAQIRNIRRNPQVIIGTPGRLKDLFGRNVLNPENMRTVVLDEADRMLDMGFVNEIREIVGLLPKDDRQTLCFSATLSPGIQQIVHDFMNNPEMVSVKVNETSDHIFQDIVKFSDDMHKKELLVNMLSDSEFEKVIVFGETKFGVQRLSDSLERGGISSTAIHGNKSQSQRTRALRAFTTNQAKVLVATDVAARGLDIPNVSHVINFDEPQTYDDYVHRIGRTGRGGKPGTAYTFVKGSSQSTQR